MAPRKAKVKQSAPGKKRKQRDDFFEEEDGGDEFFVQSGDEAGGSESDEEAAEERETAEEKRLRLGEDQGGCGNAPSCCGRLQAHMPRGWAAARRRPEASGAAWLGCGLAAWLLAAGFVP